MTALAWPLAGGFTDGRAPQVRMLDLDALVEQASQRRVVMLGEATHGTHDFYDVRARISQRLIDEHGFTTIAVEGDWPDCAVVDAFVRTPPDGPMSATGALRVFQRWPTWMWANREVARFIETVREHNWSAPEGDRVGFHGLDVYSLWDSLAAVERYLDEHAPGSVEAARRAFRCFQPYGGDEQSYASATAGFVPVSCEREVVALLAEMAQYRLSDDEGFDAEQNALVAKNAELYYRTMVRGGPESWNVRDRHIQLTLERLLARRGEDAKAIVWAHNTHIGDARATDMAEGGMVNLGQLARERWSEDDVFLVGFGTRRGATTSRPCRTSATTRSCSSTRRARWNRSTSPWTGTKQPRLGLRDFEPLRGQDLEDPQDAKVLEALRVLARSAPDRRVKTS